MLNKKVIRSQFSSEDNLVKFTVVNDLDKPSIHVYRNDETVPCFSALRYNETKSNHIMKDIFKGLACHLNGVITSQCSPSSLNEALPYHLACVKAINTALQG